MYVYIYVTSIRDHSRSVLLLLFKFTSTLDVSYSLCNKYSLFHVYHVCVFVHARVCMCVCGWVCVYIYIYVSIVRVCVCSMYMSSRNKLRVRRFLSLVHSPIVCISRESIRKIKYPACTHVHASIYMCMYTIKRNTMLILFLCAKVHVVHFFSFPRFFHFRSRSRSLECTRD